MKGGIVPASLLFAALGLALASAPRVVRASSLLVLLATLTTFSCFRTPQAGQETAFSGCWIAVIATAMTVYWGRKLGPVAALALSVDAVIWANAVLSPNEAHLEPLKAASCTLIIVPATWAVRRFGSVPIRVVSSWVIAVAVLALGLQLLPVTLGYLPDHLE